MPMESRRTSARIKAEPGLKRRFSDALEAETTTPSKPTKAARTGKVTSRNAAAKQQPVQGPSRPILPTKITESTPLPVLPEPQAEELKESDWQSLPDSGVLTASLARARHSVVKGAYFESFWTKPVPVKKQKDMTEEEKAQFKIAKGPTMTKLGVGTTIISEPLTFEVQLLMVKDPNPGHRFGQLPPERYNLPQGISPNQTMSPVPHSVYRPPVQYQTPAPPRPPPPITPSPALVRPPQAHPQSSTPPTTHPQVVIAALPPPPPPARTNTPVSAPKPASTPRAPQAPATPQAPDPVIHALAQRASANAGLKAVMKIVATGRASQQELAYFQKHIDELTEMVKQRQEQEGRANAPVPPQPRSIPQPQVPARTLTPQVPAHMTHGQAFTATPTPVPRPVIQQYHPHPTPVVPRPKAPLTAPPLHVLIQFSENANERFLFPKHSILEFLDGCTGIICSFLVLKKKGEKEYWTPVTLTLKGEMSTLNVLGRLVEPADVVRKHMEDIMMKHERADEGFLALRLPREKLAIELS